MMNISSLFMHTPLAFVVTCVYLMWIAHLVYRIDPRFTTGYQEYANRYQSVDGLRGFLALGVFFHHAIIAYFEQKSGVWEAPPVRFYALAGPDGVSLFFMITGFLFWEKAMVNQGKLPVWKLYKARFRRLAPAYYFSVLLVLLVMVMPIGDASVSELGWSEIKNVLMFAGFRNADTINMVYWTLIWEWKFYILLPLLALFARGWRAFIPAALITAYALSSTKSFIVLNFVCGGFAAYLVHRYDLRRICKTPIASLIALISLALVFFVSGDGYSVLQSMFMLIFFLCIVYGNSLFGVLHTAAANLMGSISYSIYLLHCIMVYVVIHTINLWTPVSQFSETEYWTLVPMMGVLTLVLAHISYRYFEYPFLRKP